MYIVIYFPLDCKDRVLKSEFTCVYLSVFNIMNIGTIYITMKNTKTINNKTKERTIRHKNKKKQYDTHLHSSIA